MGIDKDDTLTSNFPSDIWCTALSFSILYLNQVRICSVQVLHVLVIYLCVRSSSDGSKAVSSATIVLA